MVDVAAGSMSPVTIPCDAQGVSRIDQSIPPPVKQPLPVWIVANPPMDFVGAPTTAASMNTDATNHLQGRRVDPMANESKYQNDNTDPQLPTVGSVGIPTHVAKPTPVAGEIADIALYPKSLQKRFAHRRHHVVVEEVDMELLMVAENDVRDPDLITA